MLYLYSSHFHKRKNQGTVTKLLSAAINARGIIFFEMRSTGVAPETGIEKEINDGPVSL
ncbi:MAG: hypothetical protein ACXW1U_13975 [Methylobacter sp.]